MHINPHEITIGTIHDITVTCLVKSPVFSEEICPDCGPCRAMWSRATAAWRAAVPAVNYGSPHGCPFSPEKM